MASASTSMTSRVKSLIPSKIKRKLRGYLSAYTTSTPVSVPYEIKLVNPDTLKGQIAVITGGSGTIGRSICCHLAAEGAVVYVCGMSDSKIDAVVSEISDLGGTAYAQKLDVSSDSAIVGAFCEIAQKHGKIDILVNCAGGSARAEHSAIINQETSVIDKILSINLRGVILCTREAAKVMVENKYGRIITISSIIGERGKADFAEYAAAKAGVITFTKSIAMEIGKFGVTANCVSPGIVQRGGITASFEEYLKTTNWLNSYGKPEDTATMVSYLASQQACFVTGQNFIVDGGRSLGMKGD